MSFVFLRPEPNPHQSGRMTRAVLLKASADQTYAIDAEWLHKQPQLLNQFGEHMDIRFRLLDTMAYLLCLLGVIGSFSVAWWLFLPGIAACVMMLAVNRKSAGEIARKQALRSVDAFRHLHEIGALWLVPA